MQLSEEHKAKMRAGRARAAADRKEKGITRAPKRRTFLRDGHHTADPPVLTEFFGITKNDCPVDCTADKCVITGTGHCGHPCKGGIQPIHMSNRDTLERYNRAKKHLAHVELDKRP